MRLNQQHHREIWQKVLDHAFGKRQEKLTADKWDLGDDVYADLYSESVRAHMYELPDGFLTETDSLYVSVGGQRHQILFSNLRRVAESHYNVYEGAKSYSANHAFSSRFAALDRESRKFREEIDHRRAEVMAVLRSCATTRQLLARWPEVAPFVSAVVPVSVKKEERALSVVDLNLKLGLMPAKKTA